MNFLDKFLAHTVVTTFGVKFDSLPLTSIPFLISYSIPISCNIIFFIVLLNLYWRLESVQKLYKDSRIKSRKHLKMATNIFDKITETISFVNRYYVAGTVASFLDLLVLAITLTYLIYDVIVHSRNLSNFLIIAGGFSYMVVSGTICILVIACSSFIRNIQDKIIASTNELAVKHFDRKIKNFCIISTLFLENSRTEISSELFDFNWKYILVLISSFFSFLIVMIQFDFMVYSN